MIDRDMDDDARKERESSLEKSLKTKVDILLGAAEFATLIESDRRPDAVETVFTFAPDDNPQAAIPKEITDELDGPLDFIQISQEGQLTSDRTAYSVIIAGQSRLINFSKQAHDPAGPTKIYLQENNKDAQVLCTLPQEDINRLFASLIFPSKDSDWRFFDNVDIQDSEMAKNIAESFEKFSFSTLIRKHYLLSDSDGGISGELDVIEEDGSPSSIIVSRRVVNDMSLDSNLELTYHERSIAAQIDLDSKTSIEFYILDSNAKKRSKITEPDEAELNAMLEFIGDAKVRLGLAPPELMGQDPTESEDDPNDEDE